MAERRMMQRRPGAKADQAEQRIADLFEAAGWEINPAPDPEMADLSVVRENQRYAIAIKVSSEGRSDRLIPLWSQAAWQADRAAQLAGNDVAPLAIVVAPGISERALDQILRFAEQVAPHVAAGVVDLAGNAHFRGAKLDGLNAAAHRSPARPGPAVAWQPGQLFSDLNQWMLKVLLAPELSPRLLWAPRESLRNASALAEAAEVSVMSAYRFVRQMRETGFLDDSAPFLRVVRRPLLFDRWKREAVPGVREVPVRFILRSDASSGLRRLLSRGEPCLGLFAAADALGFGFVRGVPPHIYLPRHGTDEFMRAMDLVPALRGESPDAFLRQAHAPRSIFRGAVRDSGMPTSDIIQVWLDVSSHEARGEEQAELIWERVIKGLAHGDDREQ